MRIAVLIIGLLMNIVLFLQTVLVSSLGSAIDDEASAGAGAVGVMVSLLWLIACALVIAFPMVSVALFSIAAVFSFAVSGDFPDMGIWGGIALALAFMSFLGWRGKKKQARAILAERQRQDERDDRLENLMRQQTQMRHVAESETSCASCGASNTGNTKFCGECGAVMRAMRPA